ncbi:MAG TPA: riboflavin synthase [Pirellulales bacterium]|nr:riboflavin synthase [Pirellulales bacterium]
MFTGLVQCLGSVVKVVSQPPGKRIVVRPVGEIGAARVGDSVAINGCCLTAIEVSPTNWAFEAGPETLRRTNLGELTEGSVVNLERSLAVGDLLGGHFVTGHIDGVGTVARRDDEGDWTTMWFRYPAELAGQIASKGSIAVDGVSLTLVDVEPDRFSVALIPHTLQVTTLGRRQVGDRVNLESDLLAKYVERLQEVRGQM